METGVLFRYPRQTQETRKLRMKYLVCCLHTGKSIQDLSTDQ